MLYRQLSHGNSFILKNQPGNGYFINTEYKQYDSTIKNGVESYRVILTAHDAKRVTHIGFPGVLLSIHGDLHFENKPEVVAHKIEFMDYPGNNQDQPSFLLNMPGANHNPAIFALEKQRLFHTALRQNTCLH